MLRQGYWQQAGSPEAKHVKVCSTAHQQGGFEAHRRATPGSSGGGSGGGGGSGAGVQHTLAAQSGTLGAPSS